MNRLLTTIIALYGVCCVMAAANNYDNPDTIVVARDGTGQFRTVTEAIEVCRAFMDYHKVIFVRRGTYKEKIIMPVRTATRPSSLTTITPTLQWTVVSGPKN